MILADTNVVSEFMKGHVDPFVQAWAAGIAPNEIAISAITIQEIEFGIARLAEGARRTRLRSSWQSLLAGFESVVVAYDKDAATATAMILAAARRDGRGMGLADAQIAGTCIAHHLTLATRNIRDFAGVEGLTVRNPFEE